MTPGTLTGIALMFVMLAVLAGVRLAVWFVFGLLTHNDAPIECDYGTCQDCGMSSPMSRCDFCDRELEGGD